MVRKILNKFRSNRFVRNLLCWIKGMQWIKYYVKNSGSFLHNYDSSVSQAWILREAHSVEKGLSLPIVRKYFGQKKIEHLKRRIDESIINNHNISAVSIGLGVLKSYVIWHKNNDAVNSEVSNLNNYVNNNSMPIGDGGIILMRKDFTNDQIKQYDTIVKNRRSVRNFKHELVPIDLIKISIEVASYSPSVCNRQPWATAIVQDSIIVRKLLSLQAGNRGFDDSIKNLIVILSNAKAFVEEYELFEPFVDSGIFSGALVNALNSRNIGSCCLNLCVSQKKLANIIEVLGVGDYYYPIMMIACGYPADDCNVAISKRVEPIVFFK